MQSVLDGRQLLDPASKERNAKELSSTLDIANITIDEAVAGLELLSQWGCDEATKAAYAQKASSKWPEASIF